MNVNVLMIHPTKGMQDITVTNAESPESVQKKLEDIGCVVLFAEKDTKKATAENSD